MRSTTSRVFIDTNILVYTMDEKNPARRSACEDLLRQARHEGGVISTQVLQELYVVATGKLGLQPLTVKGFVHSLRRFEVVQITPDLIEQAIDCAIINQLSFWDALIVVCAESARCARLWTEDLSHGQVIRGVRIENPLAKP